ncbi:hypothetical protein LIER_13128 [Lithospermum erythrorhizon]|uniref:Transmembrane protein n=1 Tax=Lithospermum erythrorhizon TaxID=34254 RepID=A0AAV3PWD7_LITER
MRAEYGKTWSEYRRVKTKNREKEVCFVLVVLEILVGGSLLCVGGLGDFGVGKSGGGSCNFPREGGGSLLCVGGLGKSGGGSCNFPREGGFKMVVHLLEVGKFV